MSTVPEWATSMVQNWRVACDLPDHVTDYAIFKLVNGERLTFSNSDSEIAVAEKADVIDYVRETLLELS